MVMERYMKSRDLKVAIGATHTQVKVGIPHKIKMGKIYLDRVPPAPFRGG